MLETRNLVKIYKPKKGVPVKALDNVSLKFPDTGMVFLLGKSGSGKSTLLNVLGGLDRYNSGEILIKGKSSRTFRQQHFDSYRNTYVGFIFQEYNILDEFSVGANIALALQLQGIKPTNEQINHILAEVDLEGYGSRKPNELSGGQKQRVAIARALVKSPKIIMADEPTGALDSATGRQILTTLKKLSKDKLVIVVSHDREFAEQYADRIVELADGQVIRDVERRGNELPAENQAPVFEGDSVSLSQGYVLTDEDREAILRYIESTVSQGKAPKFELTTAESTSFQPTDESRIVSATDGYRLIKSKLPMKYAFKMGASGLKHKKFRLVMTILLSCIAFILFGLADTMASYDYVTTSVSSLSDPDSQITYAALEKQQAVYYGDGEDDYYWDYSRLTEEDYALIKEHTGITMYPVYSDASSWLSGIYLDLSFYSHIASPSDGSSYFGNAFYQNAFGGYVEISEELMEAMGAQLVEGRLPQQADELAISSHILLTFEEYGYQADYGSQAETIRDAEDIIGKTLTLDGITYTVTGVVDTGIDYSRYDALKEELDETAEFTDQLLWMVLQQELRYSLNYSLNGLAMVSEGQLDRIYAKLADSRDLSALFYLYGDNYWQNMGNYATLSQLDDTQVVWLDGKARTALSDNEVILSEKEYMNCIDASGLTGTEYDFRMQYQSENPNYSAIAAMDLTLDVYTAMYESHQVRIVGILPTDADSPYSHVISDDLMGAADITSGTLICQTIAAMPTDIPGIRALAEFTDLEFADSDGNRICFELMNPVSFELKNLDEIFEFLRTVFMWVGVVFVIFASLLFSNFIATSISYKKREIGILRAIGSRSNDVFRIFFAESFIIAMINFVLSLGGTVAICGLINYFVRYQAGLLLTILNVGIRQVGLLFGICLLVAFVASFLPVRKIAAKRPIDAIRDR